MENTTFKYLIFVIFFLIVITTEIIVLSVRKTTVNEYNSPEIYTNFIGTGYMPLITGELTKAHVTTAELTGTITGMSIGTAVMSIGNANDTAITAPFANKTGISTFSFNNVNDSRCTTIGNYSLKSCKNFSELILPNTITYIGDFSIGQTNITAFTVPPLVTTLTQYSFAFTASGLNVDFNNVEIIQDYAFYYSGITNLSLPNTLTSIGSNAFVFCINVDSVTIPNSITSLGNSAFFYCSGLSILAFESPSQLVSLPANTFKNCLLTTLSLPASISTIGSECFNSNTLTSVTFEGTGVSRTITCNSNSFPSPASLVSASSGGTISVADVGSVFV
jgi:hypothetical protein